MKEVAPIRKSVMLKVAGKQYVCDPLTIADLGEIEAELQRKLFEIAKRNLDGLEDEDRKSVLRDAWDDTKKLRIGTPEFQAAFDSPFGVAYSFYLSARGHHPDMTLDTAMEVVASMAVEARDKLEQARASGVDVNPTTAATPTTETPQTPEPPTA